MAEIIPAILPKSYDELEEKLAIAVGHTPCVQIDICDGKFVPSKTWPYLKGPNVEDTIFNDIIAQEKALPEWEHIDFEFDLMISDVYEKIPDFVSAGASRIVVHKAGVDDTELMAIIRDFGKQSDDIGAFDIELGIALRATDSVDAIKDIAEHVHFVQVMGIQNVGFQGQVFDRRALELVTAIKALYPNLPVSVDGGVNPGTAPRLIAAGADRLVVGSALFGSVDFSGTLEMFKAL